MQEVSSLQSEISKIIRDHENSKCADHTEKEGIFYTPVRIAVKMANTCLRPLVAESNYEQLLNIKILDPSCGTGMFLVVCYELLIDRLKELNIDNLENRSALLLSCIHGIDKDVSALEIARSLLSRVYCDENSETKIDLCRNVIAANALFDLKDFKEDQPEDREILNSHQIICWESAFPSVFKNKNPGFSLVLGNPPYGIARGEKLSEAENKKLQKIYSSYKLGKVNKYLAFMAKGLEVLQTAGTLSYIVPNAWLGISAGKGIREALNSCGSIEKIECFDSAAFPGIEVECIIFSFKKALQLKNISLVHYADAKSFQQVYAGKFPRLLCSAANDFIIPLKWSERLNALKEYFTEHCINLGAAESPFEPLIAIQAYSVGKGSPPQSKETVKSHAYHGKEKLSNEHIPYLEGKDIRRYSIDWSKSYLHHGKHLAEPQTLRRFSGPRLLIREILNPAPYALISAYTEEIYLYNKSVLHIISKAECDGDDFYALLAILNSSLAGRYIQSFGRKSQRKLFPKIVNADLKNFPLPKTFRASKQKLAELARRASITSQNKHEFLKIQEALDQAVLEAYKLQASDLED